MNTRSFGKTYTAQPIGSGAELITVEADVTRGLHSFSIVGLPDKAVEEAKDRLSAALRHSGFPSPKAENHKITLSLSPADIKKEGSHYDLPLAISYLSATNALPPCEETLFLGELSLDGNIRGVRGVLPALVAGKKAGLTRAFIPKDNEREAILIQGMEIFAVSSLKEIADHLHSHALCSPILKNSLESDTVESLFDLIHIKGQESAKRALEIAATGRHNIVFYGPPGTGKTMLARTLPTILPPLSEEDMLAVASIHSTAGILDDTMLSVAPFRSPHHSTSHVALVGGGSFPKAGEVTLAHKGVLFLDEFPEFEKRSIEALRQPLEDRMVTVSRARGTVTFPADFILVAAMNPDQTLYGAGTVAPARHTKKISLPIVDRIDVWIEVPHISHDALVSMKGGESSAVVRERVITARKRAHARYGREETNGRVRITNTEELLPTPSATKTLVSAGEKLGLSPRAFHRVLRTARTIADLEGSEKVEDNHVLEALQYRPRNLFN